MKTMKTRGRRQRKDEDEEREGGEKREWLTKSGVTIWVPEAARCLRMPEDRSRTALPNRVSMTKGRMVA